MHSFADGFLTTQMPTHGMVRSIALIAEHKGHEELFRRQSPQVLETLRRAAVISSTEASNRIEGIVASRRRIEQLVEGSSEPRDRPEQEIAGYRDVLSTIHDHRSDIPLTSGTVLQLHRDLFQFSPQPGGRWKTVDNEIVERLPDGGVRLRFQPVPAFETPAAMDALHAGFATAWERGEIDRLLLVAAYVLDFLCIHPFLDGNGRMARLLTLLLLYRAGFGVGRFISLEQIVERSRESYYEALAGSSYGWHRGAHSLRPWWEYFLGVMLAAYRDFERRVGETAAPRGAKRELVMRVVRRLGTRFRYGDVAAACPGVSRPTIYRALKDLAATGEVRCLGTGRGAEWERVERAD
jgi:Fic family protein